MSILKTGTIEDVSSGGSVDAAYIVHGTIKAWGVLLGTGVIALQDSLNLSSVTDNGTGDYVFNFNNDFATTNRCVGGTGANTAAANGKIVSEAGVVAAGATRVLCSNFAGTIEDYDHIYLSSLGDLA